MLEKILEVSSRLDADDLSCFDLIRCVFNLKETDLQVLRSMETRNGTTISQLSKKLKKDRSTVHRSLEKLVACNMCYKQRKCGRIRGFVDYYYSIPDQEILKKAEQNLDNCYSKMKQILKQQKKKERL